MIEGSYTIYAKELIDKGFTPEVIIEELKEIREQAGAYLIVDDLKNLQWHYQSATQAGEMVEGVNVHTFDSKLAMIEGSYTIYAKELIDKGFTPEVIIEELKEIREQAGAYLIVDDLKNLQKADV